MPICPKCTTTLTSTATRCPHCGASLTQRFAKDAPAPEIVRSAPSGAISGWLVVGLVALVVGVLALVGLRFASSINTVEIDQGIRVELPEGWKQVRTGTLSGMATHSYRGDPAEKVALTMMTRRNAPQEIRSKVHQSEALLTMVTAILDEGQPLPVVIDLSHDDVVHVQTTIDDHAILGKPSAELAVDDFKHMCLGTIIRGGDFIHYEIAYDEKDAKCESVLRSMDALAWGR